MTMGSCSCIVKRDERVRVDRKDDVGMALVVALFRARDGRPEGPSILLF